MYYVKVLIFFLPGFHLASCYLAQSMVLGIPVFLFFFIFFIFNAYLLFLRDRDRV